MISEFPQWVFYPKSSRPPKWVYEFVGSVLAARADIESAHVDSLTSDAVLGFLRPGLEALGYQVETGKARTQKIEASAIRGLRARECGVRS